MNELNKYCLLISSSTWHKDSHSLFDYQSPKVSFLEFNFPLSAKNICIHRTKQSNIVVAFDNKKQLSDFQFQTLAKLEILHSLQPHKVSLNFHNVSNLKQQQPFYIISKLKDLNGEPKGYVLKAGQTIKLGRVQYYVSEICSNGVTKIAVPNKKMSKFKSCRSSIKYIDNKSIEKSSCKICLQQNQTKQNLLLNPCKCTGSCGTVHMNCLLQWINFKVKKEVVGGTQHYNFEKFQCQVCKTELPMIIQINNTKKELLPIQKPKDNYMILEAACEKLKSVILVQNVPNQGIKLGRGHQCQIRIPDISVSRTHSLIKYINNNFVIFDNKSKFGTLVKEENMYLEAWKKNSGLQIGRTVLNFEIIKKKQ